MKCKAVKKSLLYFENKEVLSGELVKHIENCEECREYLKQINEMRRSLGEKQEYSNMDIEISLNNLKVNDSFKSENIKYKTWMNSRRNRLAVGLLVFVLLLAIPINKTTVAMELLNLWKDKISISNNKKEIVMNVGEYKVDLEREYTEFYQLITERNNLINEIVSKNGNGVPYEEIDKIIEEYHERLKELDYQKINPKPNVYKGYKNMEDLQKEITLDKRINPAIPEIFQLGNIIYSEYGDDYKRLDLEYYDNNNENRINYEKRKLGITYVIKKQSEEVYSYSFQKGSKLKKISIGEYEGYILNKGNEKYSDLCVGVFMNDCEVTVYSKSKLEDASENESMLIEIAKSIANQ